MHLTPVGQLKLPFHRGVVAQDGKRAALVSEHAHVVVDWHALSGRMAAQGQFDGYLDGLVDRDFEEIGKAVRRPQALRCWMVACGAATSSAATHEKTRDAAAGDTGDKPTKNTVVQLMQQWQTVMNEFLWPMLGE